LIVTSELALLALSIGLGCVPIVVASHAARLQRGCHWTASAAGIALCVVAIFRNA